MNRIIEIKNLNKSFGEIKAVQNLSFQVKQGELFAFLGVNGAGKSTTISMLCGQLQKDSGTILVDGMDIEKYPDESREKIGVVFQSSVLDKALTVKDNLKTRAALYGVTGNAFNKRVDEIDELLHIKELMKRTVGKLSGGQRRRIDIARALLHNPQILILDEPTTGLDPQTRKAVWSGIERLREQEGMTVFLTTHYMEEASDADYVVILQSGKVAAEGTPLKLKNTYTGDFITLYGIAEEQIKEFGLPYDSVRDGFRIQVPNTAAATELILKNPSVFKDYEITKGKMDDVFLNVTGIKLEGGDM